MALTTAAKLSGSDNKDIGGEMHFIIFDPPACPFIIFEFQSSTIPT
jgi:hypothetical protein